MIRNIAAKEILVKTGDAGPAPAAPHDYFAEVAEARYVLRRVFRITEEQARDAGLDPLAHQALIQIYGSAARRLRVNELAERLDIAPAFASSLLKSLAGDGMIDRRRDEGDHRVTWVSATDAAIEKLVAIDAAVGFHVDYFAAQIPANDRKRALATLKFYVGLG
jgi:DNA-binding MarR family transcriptional regulator